jgi:hypothetical protein
MPGDIYLCNVLQPNFGLQNCHFPVKVGVRVLIFSLNTFPSPSDDATIKIPQNCTSLTNFTPLLYTHSDYQFTYSIMKDISSP